MCFKEIIKFLLPVTDNIDLLNVDMINNTVTRD